MTFYGKHPWVKKSWGSANAIKLFETFGQAKKFVNKIKKKYGKKSITYQIRVAPAYYLRQGYTAQVAIWIEQKDDAIIKELRGLLR